MFVGWVGEDPSLALFHKHFAVMHCLYSLESDYREQGWELFISPLRIQLFKASVSQAKSSNVSAHFDAVRDYYLEWSHFEEATSDTVAELLNGFWRRFSGADEEAEALATLDLSEKPGWPAVQAQYRRLAAAHHPDKGGDQAEFMRIRGAYEVLKKAR